MAQKELPSWRFRMVGGTELQGERAPLPVCILLSVYNGEAYLNAQLDSFLAQTHSNWIVYWRDDGSSDASRAIMLSFQANRGLGRCVEVLSDTERLGVAASYARLLAAVPENRMVAYADQDDVWLPEKLAWGVQALAGSGTTPVLYCARQYLTDAALAVKSQSEKLRRSPNFASALTQNIATGHTLLLNPEAARLLRSVPIPKAVLHDWWSYLLVTGVGGRVIFDERCVSYYRQHGHNTVGVQRSHVRRALAALRRGPRLFMNIFATNVASLMEISDRLTPESRNLLSALQHVLQRGTLARMRLLRGRRDLVRQTRHETWLFRLWFLLYASRQPR